MYQSSVSSASEGSAGCLPDGDGPAVERKIAFSLSFTRGRGISCLCNTSVENQDLRHLSLEANLLVRRLCIVPKYELLSLIHPRTQSELSSISNCPWPIVKSSRITEVRAKARRHLHLPQFNCSPVKSRTACVVHQKSKPWKRPS